MILYAAIMAEISVIEDTSEGVNVYALPKRDKEDLFEELITDGGKRPKDLAQRHSFVQLFSQKDRVEPEKLPDSLLIREIVANQLRYDRLIAFPLLADQKKSRSGGAIKVFRPVLAKKVISNVKNVENAQIAEVSFDRPTACVDVTGRNVMVAEGTVVRVIGMRLAPMCSVRVIDRTSIYESQTAYPEHVLNCSFFTKFTIGDKEVTAPYRDIYAGEESPDLYLHVAKYIYNTHVNALRLSPAINQYTDAIAIACSPGAKKYSTDVRVRARTGTGTSALVRALIADHNVVSNEPAISDVVQTKPDLSDNAFFEFVRDNFGGLTLINETANAGMLQQHGLLYAYILYQTEGLDSESVKDIISRQLRHHKAGVAEIEQMKAIFAERTKLSMYMRILQQFLSSKRFNELKSLPSTDSLLRELNAREKEKLLLEYTIEQKYIESVINNNCPHVQLYQRLRRTIDIVAKQGLLRKLSEYYDAKYAKNKLVECKKCKYNIICPHIIEMIENARVPVGVMREILRKYIADDLSRNGGQYCRICGEVMFSRVDLEEDLHAESEFDDALRSIVWSEVALIVRQMNFEHAIDTTRFISEIRNSVYPAADIIDVDLSRNQSHTLIEISHRKSLFISILAMAKIIQAVFNNSSLYLPGQRKAAASRVTLKSLFELGAEFVFNTHNVAITSIGGMTRENIQEKIRLAYEHLGSEVASVEKIKTETVDEMRHFIVYDPSYDWIASMNKISGPDTFNRVFNLEKLKKLQAGESIYKAAKMPFSAAKSFSERVFSFWMSTVLGKEPKMFYSSPDSPSLLLTPEYVEFMKIGAELIAEEKKFTDRDRSKDVNWSSSRLRGKKEVQLVQVRLGEIYDEDGAEHVFDQFIVAGKTYKRNELRDIMISGRTDSVFGAGAIISKLIKDRVCSVCGVKESLMSKLDEEKIMRALENKTRIGGFFKFYEKRCPSGVSTLHEWDQTGFTCQKCGLNLSATKVERLNYYREYKDIYKKQREISRQSLLKHEHNIDYSVPKPDWKENFQYVIDVANVANVEPREIQYIGAYEGVDHEDIINGKYTPVVVEKRNDTRVWVVHGIVTNLISSFERLRNYSKLRTRDFTIETIIAQHNRSELRSMESVTGNFYELFTYFYRHEEPERIVTMCIQEWCYRLVSILKQENSSTLEVRKKFVQHHIEETLRYQALLTTREPFNWAIVFGNKKSASDVIANEEHTGEEPVGKEKDDPFSLDAYDVEDEVKLNLGDGGGLD